MPSHPARRLRAIRLAPPKAAEKKAWGDPTFRVRDRISATATRRNGRVPVRCKAPPSAQAVLAGTDPERFSAPPQVCGEG